MNRQPWQNAKAGLARIWTFVSQSGALTGCLAACLAITAGRAWVRVSTSTLSGWTTLCLLAIFLGLLVANLRSRSPFISKLQALGLLLGSLTSLTALILLEYTQDLASNTFLGFSAALLIPCLMGFRTRQAGNKPPQEKTLVYWALRLDDLMKYGLSPASRSGVARLIDLLWHSPPDQDDFIPGENARFEQLLGSLEQSVQAGSIIEIETTISELHEYLQTRNLSLARFGNIEYRRIDHGPLLSSDTEPPRQITLR